MTLSVTVGACGGDDGDDGSGGGSLEGANFTFAGFGGSTQAAMIKAWIEPFEESTGATVGTDEVDYAKIQAQVESGNVSWDVVETEAFFTDQHCGEFFLPRDSAIVESIDNAREGTVTNECGIPAVGFSTLLAYDADEFGDDPPQNWEAFFDTDRYPGKRLIWNYALSGTLEAALLADGVDRDDLYPLDTDRAFAKLETIKDDLVFASTIPQLEEFVLSGQGTIANIFNGRLLSAVREGANWEPVWQDNLQGWDNLAVVKGSNQVDAGMEYLEYLLDPEVQNRLNLYSPYNSMLKGEPSETKDQLTAEFLANTPDHLELGIQLDYGWWATNFDRVNEEWTAFASG
jgi:putative spermidine/putrescine transport system substrate-binding protein